MDTSSRHSVEDFTLGLLRFPRQLATLLEHFRSQDLLDTARDEGGDYRVRESRVMTSSVERVGGGGRDGVNDNRTRSRGVEFPEDGVIGGQLKHTREGGGKRKQKILVGGNEDGC